MPNLTTQSYLVGNLFREAKPLAIPIFQRDFSWDREKVEQLWRDTWAAIEDGSDTYFIGSIVIKDSSSLEAAEVIDGQQRLTTLSLLLCALRDAARSYNDMARATSIDISYLCQGMYISDEDHKSPKLTLNQTNRLFYEEHILNNADEKSLEDAFRSRRVDKSNRLMASAYIYFRQEIRKLVESGVGM